MTLVLFDIDGTLTATTDSDARCYARAFEQVFGIPLPTTDWHTYTHVTDIGIIDETLQRTGRAALNEHELEHFEQRFLREIEEEHAANPAGFAEIPGARAIIERLCAHPDYTVALSTGGMRATATFKLKCIGVDAAGIPGGYANDARSRADIARIAMARADAVTADIVYVGDGLWDAVTSAALGMRFVAITRESCRDRLRSGGATVFVDDYANQDAFLAALRHATVPSPLPANVMNPAPAAAMIRPLS
ncbi:MAG: HAD family hydrolase [Candidatus Hydrogenedentes bacterium]|nr:HAD family hydrolase [Candidatus Hydrogenedentota bacterium]